MVCLGTSTASEYHDFSKNFASKTRNYDDWVEVMSELVMSTELEGLVS
jgi:hypothetical protein